MPANKTWGGPMKGRECEADHRMGLVLEVEKRPNLLSGSYCCYSPNARMPQCLKLLVGMTVISG